MARLLVVTTVVVLLAGCGGHGGRKVKTSAVAPRSVAEVRRVFLRNGISLSRLGSLGLKVRTTSRLRYTALVGDSEGILINVAVHPTVERDVWFSSLTPRGQKPRVAFARNVVATWGGPDLPAVRAAIKELK